MAYQISNCFDLFSFVGRQQFHRARFNNKIKDRNSILFTRIFIVAGVLKGLGFVESNGQNQLTIPAVSNYITNANDN